MVEISYNSMWPGFDYTNNWFNYLFNQYFKEDIVFSNGNSNADIVLNSVFGPRLDSKGINIFYTGEAHKNNYDSKDILLGFDETSIENKIFRLPIWYLYVNWWSEKNEVSEDIGYKININELCLEKNEKDFDAFFERKFCSIVSSNDVPNRFLAYDAISSLGKVDAYGNAFNNYYNGSKLNLIKNYKFNICFENCISEGYVTEKLFEAKLAGCIPIYWGSSYSKKDFNEKMFIDYSDINDMGELINSINSLNISKQLLKEKFCEPLFTNPPLLEPIFNFFDKVGLK